VGGEIRRNGAKPGDRIWVSGTICDAWLGLKVLRGEFAGLRAAAREALTRRFRLPEPRCALWPRLAGIAHALVDVSDGLLADLGHICETSRVAATVDLPALPLSEAAQYLTANQPGLAAQLTGGGDDYELLFTAPQSMRSTIEALSAELGLLITQIGAIERGDGVRLIDSSGVEIAVGSAGWRHF